MAVDVILLCCLILLQIKDEVKSVLEFINYVYEIFGFKYELELSTVFFCSYIGGCKLQL